MFGRSQVEPPTVVEPIMVSCESDGSEHTCNLGTQRCQDNSPLFCRTADPNDCDLLNPPGRTFFNYFWNQESCRCLYMDDQALDEGYCARETSIDTPVESPLDGTCISEADYFAVYYHTLGPDCLLDTPDDGPKDPDYCPPGFAYDMDFCQCLTTA